VLLSELSYCLHNACLSEIGRVAFWQEKNGDLWTDNYLSAVVKGNVEAPGEVMEGF
jgi:hypothetical protein